MQEAFLIHYNTKLPAINQKLTEFVNVDKESEQALLSEMIFCIFAANSSAEMGELAQKLLTPKIGASIEEMKAATHKRVRFYNKRTEYFFYNLQFLAPHGGISQIIKNHQILHELRHFLIQHLMGFGYKEASHYLRNLGFSGLCIIDKHILRFCKEIKILRSDKAPKNGKEYIAIENKIIRFCQTNNYNIDAFDLAVWSMKTGKLIK
jgi:N-glycosylase/DNA lyase